MADVTSVVPKPVTAEYVQGLYRYALDMPEERGLRLFIAEIRRLFDMQHRVRIPKEYRSIAQEVRTPFLRDVALRVTASLTKDPHIITVEPRDSDMDAKRAAVIAQRWTMATTHDMNAMLGEDAVYQSALHLVRDSESVLKVVHRPDAWANFPVRGDDEGPIVYKRRADKHKRGGVRDPFAWRNVDRLQMLFGDGEYGDEWCIEYGEYPLPYLDRRYLNPDIDQQITPATKIGGAPFPEAGEWLAGSATPVVTSGPAGRTIKLEYFDANTWAVVINGQMAPGFPKPNPYAPMLPYFRTTSYPALYALRYLVPAIDSLLTMKLNWAYLSAFPVVVMEPLAGVSQMLDSLPTGDSGAPPANMTWRPGQVYFPPNGYTMKFLEPPKTGADLDALIVALREMIDIAGIPNVFRGVGGARQAGYAVNQLMAAAQLTYKQMANALERQQERIARFLWHAVDHTIKTDVFVLGKDGDEREYLGLKPTGAVQRDVAPVDELGVPVCTFRPVLPTDEQSEAMIGLQDLNAPKQMLSQRTILQHYFPWVDDPDQEMDDIAVERQLNGPELSQRVLIEGMRKAGLPVNPVGQAGPGVIGSGAPPREQERAPFEPNDATNRGEPAIPGLTQLLNPREGGRVAGAFPGRPGGPEQE